MPIPDFPPVLSGLDWIANADEHAARVGVGVPDKVRNNLTGGIGNMNNYTAELDEESGLHYFTCTEVPTWPLESSGGFNLRTPLYKSKPSTRTDTRTEVFFYNTVAGVYVYDGYGGGAVSASAQPGPSYPWMEGGTSTVWATFWQSWRLPALWGAFYPKVTAPWVMQAYSRDNADTNSSWLSCSVNGAPKAPLWAITPLTSPTSTQTAIASPAGMHLMLSYDRVLSDAELLTLYEWGKTWLPEQLVGPVDRATPARISTLGVGFSWDETTHGPAVLNLDGVTVDTDFHTGDAYAADIPPAGQEYVYLLGWADTGGEGYEFTFYGPPTPLGVSVVQSLSNQVDLALNAAQTYDVVVYRDRHFLGIIPIGQTAFSDTTAKPGMSYEYRVEQAHTEAIPATAAGEVTALTPEGSTTEFWVSQGGQWVKASAVYGSAAGAWVQDPEMHGSVGGAWVPLGGAAGPTVPSSEPFTFLDPSLEIFVNQNDLLNVAANWDGDELVITWDGQGQNIGLLSGLFSIDLGGTPTSLMEHPMQGIDAPANYAGVSWAMNIDIATGGNETIDGHLAFLDSLGLMGLSYGCYSLGYYIKGSPVSGWCDWTTLGIASGYPVSPYPLPLPTGLWTVSLIVSGTSVGAGSIRFKAGTSFRWGDNPVGAVAADPEQGQRAAARADLAQAGRAVQRLGRAATPESIKPHLKRFTVEQIEDILGRQRGVESAPESE